MRAAPAQSVAVRAPRAALPAKPAVRATFAMAAAAVSINRPMLAATRGCAPPRVRHAPELASAGCAAPVLARVLPARHAARSGRPVAAAPPAGGGGGGNPSCPAAAPA